MTTPAIKRVARTIRTKCDALILIVLQEEWLEFLKTFPEAQAKDPKDVMLDGLSATITEFLFDNYRIVAAVLNQSEIATNQIMGKIPAAVFTTCLLRKYAPELLINIGIACRVNKKDVQLGDVVIATDLIDVTGNCAVEDVRRGAMPKFRPGKPNISCAGQALDKIVSLKRAHPEEFAIWQERAAEELTSIGLPVSDKLFRSGFIATGDPVSKSEAFQQMVLDVNKNITAYEMESFAIAETARLLRSKAALLFLKGLVDDGDGQKAKLESLTKGKIRAIAMGNAARLLRTAMKSGILPNAVAENAQTGKQSSAIVPSPHGFPYFSGDELADFGTLRSRLLVNNGPLVDLLEAGRSYAPGLAKELHRASSDESMIRFLNSIVDSDLWNHAGWKLPDSGDAYTSSHSESVA